MNSLQVMAAAVMTVVLAWSTAMAVARQLAEDAALLRSFGLFIQIVSAVGGVGTQLMTSASSTAAVVAVDEEA
jgi:hypothetical protein